MKFELSKTERQLLAAALRKESHEFFSMAKETGLTDPQRQAINQRGHAIRQRAFEIWDPNAR